MLVAYIFLIAAVFVRITLSNQTIQFQASRFTRLTINQLQSRTLSLHMAALKIRSMLTYCTAKLLVFQYLGPYLLGAHSIVNLCWPFPRTFVKV